MTDVTIKPLPFYMVNCRLANKNVTYENYLLEVINRSYGYFANMRTPYEYFVLQQDQSHGEADAYSSLYSVDFKLFVDERYMQAKSAIAPTIRTIDYANGIIFAEQNASDVRPYTKYPNILFDMNLYRFYENCELLQDNAPIKSFIRNLHKNKNLFMFYPYLIMSNNEASSLEQMFAILLNELLTEAMKYRVQLVPDKDVYFCLKISSLFCVYLWDKALNSFKLVDAVDEVFCPTYQALKSIAVY